MKKMTYAQAISDALREEMRRNDKVFLLGEDIGLHGGCFGITRGFLEEFGAERVMDTPISEGGFTGIAIGAAMAGYRPIVEFMFSDFLACAMDLICNQAAKQRFMMGGQVSVPLVIRAPFGSGTGAAAQHSQSLEAWFCHIPGLKVIAPYTPSDAKGLLKAAIRENNPILFFEHKLLYQIEGEVKEEEYITPIGKAEIKRSGKDLTIISYSHMLKKVEETAYMLERDGIDAEVIDLRTLSPLDSDTVIASVCKTGRALVVHESVQNFGVGAEIAALLAQSEAFYSLKHPIVRYGGENMPVPFSPELEKQAIPQAENIYAKAKEFFQ